MKLTINGAENLEIEPGMQVYEGTTDNYLEWDHLSESTIRNIERIMETVSGISAADEWGVKDIRINDWKPWSDVSGDLYNKVMKAEGDLRSLIINADRVKIPSGTHRGLIPA